MVVKMFNTVVVGLDFPFIREVVEKLDNEKTINISGWFISEKTFKEKVELKNQIHWRLFIQGDINFEYNNIIPEKIHSYLRSRYSIYIDQLVRESYFENRTVPENLSAINILVHRIYDLFVEQKVELIIFADAPHGAYANILYDIAKQMGVRTLIMFPCYMRDRFLYCWDLEDVGFYKKNNDIPSLNTSSSADELIGSFEKNVFWAPEEERTIFNALNKFISTKKESINDYNLKYDGFSDYVCRHIIRLFDRINKKHTFKEENNRLFSEKIKPGEKYVYFPMHLQPEMTTATLGKEYNDQILAMERVRNLIPDDWYIYIKENPLQTYAWRDKYFYTRLKALKNLRYLKGNTDTYELIRNCQFVATITGTAGFEAISGGKPALVFGLAWYRCLPGVTIYNEDIRLDDILKEFSEQSLKIEFEKLEKNFIKGVIADEVFQFEKFNIEENKKVIYLFLQNIITSINE